MQYRLLYIVLSFFLKITVCTGQAEIDYTNIDKVATNVPKEVEKEVASLAKFIADNATSDLEKVRGAYVWITYNISYDHEAIKDGAKRINHNNEDVLRRRKAICFGYATLFKTLCKYMKIDAEVVSGYSRGTITAIPDLEEPDHAWNAVKIDSTWHLLDATWGSSAINNVGFLTESQDNQYFLVDPRKFILSHLPQDPMWQLLSCPIDLKTFSNGRGAILEQVSAVKFCFNYQDSIIQFKKLGYRSQKIKTAENALRFNPVPAMKAELASTYIDKAGILSNFIDDNSHKLTSDSIITVQDEIIVLFRKAKPLASLFDWQWELYISTLINQAVILYNANSGTAFELALERSIGYLKEAKALLSNSTNNFFKDQASQQCQNYLQIMGKEWEKIKN